MKEHILIQIYQKWYKKLFAADAEPAKLSQNVCYLCYSECILIVLWNENLITVLEARYLPTEDIDILMCQNSRSGLR